MVNQIFWSFADFDLLNLLCPTKEDGSYANGEHIKVIKKGSYIYQSKDKMDSVYLIIEGRIKIGAFGENHKEFIKTIKIKGEIFGELALLSQEVGGEFAVAMEKSKVCVIPWEEMRSLMATNAPFRGFMWGLLGKRVMSVEKRLESLVFKNSRSRILEYLIELGLTRGQRVGYEILVRKFNTHQEIANLTATSRQTVTTTLNELRKNNFLTFDRKRLLIRDLEALQKQAMSEAVI